MPQQLLPWDEPNDASRNTRNITAADQEGFGAKIYTGLELGKQCLNLDILITILSVRLVVYTVLAPNPSVHLLTEQSGMS